MPRPTGGGERSILTVPLTHRRARALAGAPATSYRGGMTDAAPLAPLPLAPGVWVSQPRGVIHTHGERRGRLTPLELAFLAYLMAHPGRLVGQRELIEQVWGEPSFPFAIDHQRETQKVQRCLCLLRGKLSFLQWEFIETVRAEGYRFAPIPGAPPPDGEGRGNLGAETGPFVGRAVPRAELHERLAGRGGVVLLWGPPGVGVRRLGREVLRGLGLRGGAWRVPRPEGPAELIGAVEQALGLAPGPGRGAAAREEALLQVLDTRGPLGVLVETEQVTGWLADLLRRWCERVGGLRVVLAARAPGAWREGESFAVAPLPDAEVVGLYQAVSRSLGRPGEVQPSGPALAAFSGLPLLVELGARRAELLEDDDQAAPTPPTLRARLVRAWRALPPRVRKGAEAAAVFEGPFDLPAFEEVSGLDVEAFRALLTSGWIRPDPGFPGHWATPDTLRAVVLDDAEPETLAAARTRLDRRLLRLASELGPRLRREGDPTLAQALSPLVPDLEALLDRTVHAPSRGAAAVALDALWRLRGSPGRHAALLDAALAEELPPDARGRLLLARAELRRRAGFLSLVEADLDEAEALAGAEQGGARRATPARGEPGRPRVRDEDPIALVRIGRGLLAAARGQPAAAASAFEGALARTGPGTLLGARANANLAALLRRAGDAVGAEQRFMAAIQAAELHRDRVTAARARGNLGTLLSELGRLEEAEAAHRAEIAAHHAVGDRRSLGGAWISLANVHLRRGWRAEARACLGRAREVLESDGAADFLGLVHTQLGLLDLADGDLDAADRTLHHALDLERSAGRSGGVALVLHHLALLHTLRGQRGEAIRAWEQALERAEAARWGPLAEEIRGLLGHARGEISAHGEVGSEAANRLPEAVDTAVRKLALAALRRPSDVNLSGPQLPTDPLRIP